jgi:hypothetical protein
MRRGIKMKRTIPFLLLFVFVANVRAGDKTNWFGRSARWIVVSDTTNVSKTVQDQYYFNSKFWVGKGGYLVEFATTGSSAGMLTPADSGGHAGNKFMASATGLDSLLAHWNYFKHWNDSTATFSARSMANLDSVLLMWGRYKQNADSCALAWGRYKQNADSCALIWGRYKQNLDSCALIWGRYKQNFDSIAVIGPKAWAAAPKIDPIFTGTIRGASERLTGYLTTLDTMRSAWLFTGDSTGNALTARSTIGQANLGATPFAGIFGGMVRNMTPATGALQQWSPAYVWQGQGYDSLNRVSVPVYFGMTVRPIMTAGAVASAGFDLYTKIGSGSWTFLETMLSSGYHGIGTTNPGATLDVQVASAAIGLKSTTLTNRVFQSFANESSSAYLIVGRENSVGGTLITGTSPYAVVFGTYSSSAPFQFAVNNSIAMTVLNGGNVGIGTTTPYFHDSIVDLGGFANRGLHLVSSTFNLQRISATTASDTSSIGIRLGTTGYPIWRKVGATGLADSISSNSLGHSTYLGATLYNFDNKMTIKGGQDSTTVADFKIGVSPTSWMVAGDATFNITSDSTMKENIKPIVVDNLWEKFKSVPIKEYNFKKESIRQTFKGEVFPQKYFDTAIDSNAIKEKVNKMSLSEKAAAGVQIQYVEKQATVDDSGKVVPAKIDTVITIPSQVFNAQKAEIMASAQNYWTADQLAKKADFERKDAERVDKEAAVTHRGPMAQDMGAAFGDPNSKTISYQEMVNIQWMMIQEMQKRIESLEARVTKLETP